MTTKHRKRSQTAKRFATMGAATATAAVLTAGLVTPTTSTQPVNPLFKTQRGDAVSLAAAYNGYGTELDPIFPPPADIPDLTNGLGTEVYNQFQTVGDFVVRALVDAFSVPSIGEALGLTTAGANALIGGALEGALAGIPIDLAGPVSDLIAGLGLGVVLTATLQALGTTLVNQLGIENAADLLALLGFNLDDPLNLSGDALGINIVTAGAPFTLLKLLGVDLGWVPAFPNSIATDVNDTDYLNIGLSTLIDAAPALSTILGLIGLGSLGDVDLVDIRVPIVIGFGLGAFAAGAAYPQVVADLPTEPGGAAYTGTSDPLLGSITIMPMLLLRNPGRANGGLFARAYPLFRLLGIDTVTPETYVEHSNGSEIGDTGIWLGGATLIPIKIDATVEYDWLSDFPSWPNPFSLANSVAAGLFPTYILRGLDAPTIVESLGEQLSPQLAAILQSLGEPGDKLGLNFYLTIPVKDALPLMEPIKLVVDAINLFSPVKFNNPIATAFEPALTSLVNLGYTDAELGLDTNGAPGFNRTLLEAATPTAFGTLPAGIDWGQVPEVVLNQFIIGVQKAIADGLIDTTPGPNVLEGLLDLVGGLGGLTTMTQGVSAGALAGSTPDPFGSLNDIISQATGSLGLQRIGASNSQPSQAKLIQGVQDEDVKAPAVLDDFESSLSGSTLSLKDGTGPLKLSGVDAASNLRKAGKQFEDAADNARAQADKSLKKATKRLNDVAEKGRKDIERVIKDVDTQAKNSVAKAKAAQKKSQDKAVN